MRNRILITAALALALCTSVNAQSTEEHLLVLADQAFAQLHKEYVTLPNLTTERVARSDEFLLISWPLGEVKGLVKKEYIEQAFLSVGLDGLDEGLWLVFQVTGLDENVDVLLFTRRTTAGVIEFKSISAQVPDEWLLISSAPSECGGDDDVACTCHPTAACDLGCVGPGGDAWINTGDTTGPNGTGNEIYENSTNGEQGERCSDEDHFIVISPI